jgi:hypothetical protein
MKIENPSPISSAQPCLPAAVKPAKPVSASCCHALALLSGLGVVAGIIVTLTRTAAVDLSQVAGLLAFGVLWWALGDIVASLARIAQK